MTDLTDLTEQFAFMELPLDIKEYIIKKLPTVNKAFMKLVSKELGNNINNIYSQQEKKYILETKFRRYLKDLNVELGFELYDTIFIEDYVETTEKIQVNINWYGNINMDEKEEERFKIIIFKNGDKSRIGFITFNCILRGSFNPTPFMKKLENEIPIAKSKWGLSNIKQVKYNSNYNRNMSEYIEIVISE
jgi:hypothetical protein